MFLQLNVAGPGPFSCGQTVSNINLRFLIVSKTVASDSSHSFTAPSSTSMVKPSFFFCQHVLGRVFDEKWWMAGRNTRPGMWPQHGPKTGYGKEMWPQMNGMYGKDGKANAYFLQLKEGKYIFLSSRNISLKIWSRRRAIWTWDQENLREWKEERPVEQVKWKWMRRGRSTNRKSRENTIYSIHILNIWYFREHDFSTDLNCSCSVINDVYKHPIGWIACIVCK